MKCVVISSTFSWVSDFHFSIFEAENIVWAELYTTRFSSLSASITFIGVDCGKPWFI